MKQILLKKIVIVMGANEQKVEFYKVELCMAPWVRMRQENFSRYARQGENRARQNHAGRGRRPHPLALSCPAPPHCHP